MDQVYQILKRMGDPASVLNAISAFEKLASAKSQLDWKTWTHIGTDTFEHLTDNPDSVFQSSAIFISTMIEIRRKELVKKPSMTCMDHDHLITGTLRKRRCITI